jgi:DnaJ-domain-containing protein 1
MSASRPSGSGATELVAPEEFVEVLCADPELVRAEFEAIVAAAWPQPPRCRAVVGTQPVRPGHGPMPPRARARGIQPSATCRRAARWARQRSPPWDPTTPNPSGRRPGAALSAGPAAPAPRWPTVQPSDPYAALGVAPDATQAEIAHAYRQLVRRHHPDTRSERAADDTAEDAGGSDLEGVLNAYAVLRDPHRRAGYDRSRRPPGTTGRSRAGTAPVGPGLPPSDAQPPIKAGPIHWWRAP